MSDNLRSIAEKRVDMKIKFYRNLKAFIIVNGFLAIINALFSPEFWWVLFPMFFWGIGVLIDFIKAFLFYDKFDTVSYRESKIQQEMEKLMD